MKIARHVENEELFRYVCPLSLRLSIVCNYRLMDHFHKLVSLLSELWLICLTFTSGNMVNSQSECVSATDPKKSQMFVPYFIIF